MTNTKIIKMLAHILCGGTYFVLSLGFHLELLYLLPGIAYAMLIAVDMQS